MNWTTLVEAADLASALGDPALRVVDARFVILNAAPDAGRSAYAESLLRIPLQPSYSLRPDAQSVQANSGRV